MNQSVGNPGYTDTVQARQERIVGLLVNQQAKARSKRMLLTLFQNFAHVARERSGYSAHFGTAHTKTKAWADGYLQATADAINFYLEKRWAVPPLSFSECEMIIADPELKEFFDHATTEPNPDKSSHA